jgi:hypothetical protein
VAHPGSAAQAGRRPGSRALGGTSRRSHDIGLAAAPCSVHGFTAAARPGLTMKAFARVRGPDLVGQGHVPRMVMVRTGIDVTTHTRAAVRRGCSILGNLRLSSAERVDLHAEARGLQRARLPLAIGAVAQRSGETGPLSTPVARLGAGYLCWRVARQSCMMSAVGTWLHDC